MSCTEGGSLTAFLRTELPSGVAKGRRSERIDVTLRVIAPLRDRVVDSIGWTAHALRPP